MNFFGTVVVSITSAFVAAGLTAWFSLWRFRSERWWEKKFESYVVIIEALHKMKRGFDVELEASGTGETIILEAREAFRSEFRSGRSEIDKQLDLGELLLTAAVLGELRTMLRGLDAASATADFISCNEMSAEVLSRCIVRVKDLAHIDLRTKGFLPRA